MGGSSLFTLTPALSLKGEGVGMAPFKGEGEWSAFTPRYS